MGLVINKVDARIGIERTPSKMEMRTSQPKLLLHQKHAKINMHTEMPRLEIDQSEAFSSAGRKSNSELLGDAASRARENAMQYISKVAEDGNRMAQVELKGEPFADIAERDAFPEHEFGYDYLPKAGPRFNLKDGYVKIDPERNGEGIHNGVEGEYIPGEINFNYSPTIIKIYMQQHPSINFTYTGKNFDTYI